MFRALARRVLETPPRTRRKLSSVRLELRIFGNTSAYAEKTTSTNDTTFTSRKHLRVRGENAEDPQGMLQELETPPRTRRKLQYTEEELKKIRNTSAYAEKTLRPLRTLPGRGKHLRVRGENDAFHGRCAGLVETPPRTRRKRNCVDLSVFCVRNTSAYAEKTDVKERTINLKRKHLRVRGENPEQTTTKVFSAETPPRTRRKLVSICEQEQSNGNTSAYAEKTGIFPQ